MRTTVLLLLIAAPCAAAPVNAVPPAPREGEMIHRRYESPKGAVELLADAHPEGRTLHLKDIVVYPAGAKKIELGMRDLLKFRKQLVAETRAQGYTTLHITGTRLTGAKPGKTPDVWLDLRR